MLNHQYNQAPESRESRSTDIQGAGVVQDPWREALLDPLERAYIAGLPGSDDYEQWPIQERDEDVFASEAERPLFPQRVQYLPPNEFE
jgi:hypothetical protein